ncbi:MAG: gamma-glutamyltransferase family protein [Clostridiales Family XIII bacterium]|jgi:gamma-glutamyltranspeptidase/glutathione hydrolase|nr:gamma-glutamyltransferase family protein [Clostridiales Family XIII bacterium]
MMDFDHNMYHFGSRRRTVYSKNGMVACTHPLAAEAGLRMLGKGGNAIDACVAMAIALPLLEPGATSYGSDNFAIFWSKGKLHGMSSSGWSPRKMTYDYIKSKGYAAMPRAGWDSTTVPGCVRGWVNLVEKFGNLTLADVAQPAIEYAEEGHPMTPYVVGSFDKWLKQIIPLVTPELVENFKAVWYKDGKAPAPGQLCKFPEIGRFLREVVETNGESVYSGKIAQAIVDLSKRTGGLWEMEDFAGFDSIFHDPLRVNYRGYEICELPPNGQGIVALMALNIIKGFDFGPNDFGAPRTAHLQMEAVKLAFADAKRYIADTDYMSKVSCESLLDEGYAIERRKLIDMDRAQDFKAGDPPGSDTVYFAAADTNGNMISMIQSCYTPFGAGVVVPEYGLSLQSRSACFAIEEGHPNNVGPHKRPYQTIIPAFIMKDGKPLGPFGIMGGYMQPQAHMQVAMNMIDFKMNPQDALDAPRFCWSAGLNFSLEDHFSPGLVDALVRKGHLITTQNAYTGDYCDRPFGRGQIILLSDENTLIGGTEGRGDGAIYCR